MTYEMKMREEHNIGREEGRAEGRAEAVHEGMQNVVATVRDLNLDKDVAVLQLIKRYSLSQDDALEFVNSNW